MRVKSATANGQRLQPRSAECLYCGQIFRPRRRGHVFCSNFCRYRGERPLEERGEIDTEGGEAALRPLPRSGGAGPRGRLVPW